MFRARRPYLHSLLLLVFLFGLLPSPLAGPVNAQVGTPEPTVPVLPPDPVVETPVEVETTPEPTLAPEPTATATIAPTETPAPTSTPEPTATTAPTETPEPTAEPTPEPTPTKEAGIDLPTETPAPAATPTIAATPTAELTAAAPVQNTDTLTVTDPAEIDGPLALDENGTLTLSFDYIVTTDRERTTITAEIIGGDDAPVEGWTVSVNGADDGESTDATHITNGDVIPVDVTISGPTGAPHTTVRLALTSTVGVPVNTAGASEGLPAVPNEQPGPAMELVIQNREPDALIAPAAVENTGKLTCLNANTGFNVVDAVSPGETIQFQCTFDGVALLSILTGSVNLVGADTGWEIALRSTSLDLLGIGATGGETSFARSHSISAANLLNSGTARFTVLVRAPMSVTTANASATVNISARSCLTVICSTGSATLVSNVEMTQASAGGGALLDGALLGQLTQPLGSALFNIECRDVPDQVISQGDLATIDCSLRKLLNVGLVGGGVLSLDATLTVDTSLGSGVATFQGSGSNVLELSLADIANLGVGESIPFQLTVQPTCMTDVGNLHSVRVNADHSLSLVGGLLSADLTDGWATVPFTIAEGASAAPMIANISPVDFGSSMWTGKEYPAMDGDLAITISPPESGCLANGGTVVISGNTPLTRGNNQIDNQHITVTDIFVDSNWGYVPTAPGGNLTTAHTVFTVNDATAATPDTTVTVTLNFQPPPGTSPGDYEGNISITTTPGPSAGE